VGRAARQGYGRDGLLGLTQQRLEQEIRESEHVEQELLVARRIQQASLPKEVPTLDGWEISPHYQPAREVGGDFYDRPSKLTLFCVLALAVKRNLRQT
jgi:serine phosphatase RsbU (regulator of sigma subunit)